jgi:FKBP-type peptidyl-prolyl cis-trans isomerase SlpA
MAAREFPEGVPGPGSLVAFATPDGEEIAAIVKDIREHEFLVDFNHPLAGRVLRLRYQVLAVTDPDVGRC